MKCPKTFNDWKPIWCTLLILSFWEMPYSAFKFFFLTKCSQIAICVNMFFSTQVICRNYWGLSLIMDQEMITDIRDGNSVANSCCHQEKCSQKFCSNGWFIIWILWRTLSIVWTIFDMHSILETGSICHQM